MSLKLTFVVVNIVFIFLSISGGTLRYQIINTSSIKIVCNSLESAGA